MIGTLTGLRGFATILVLVNGLEAAGVLPSEFGHGLDQVALMVVVTLSGYLLALRHQHLDWHRDTVGDFLRGRARRLLPLYFAVVALSAVLTVWWTDWPYRIGSQLVAVKALLLISAPSALWIVPVLAQLSVLFLAVWWMWRRTWHPAAIVALGIALFLPVIFGWVQAPGHSVSVVAPLFLAGVGTGLGWESRVEPFLQRHARVVSGVGAVAFFLTCVNLPAVRLAHGWTFGHWLLASTWFDPLTVVIVMMLVVATTARPPSLAILRSRPLQILGWCFYPTYLAMPVLAAIVK
jgi:peptidoglycan/LPS O-acetylase OafA/YrhL